MAYINVAEWNPDQVTDWLKGIDDSMYNYVYSFTNNEVGGHQLLHIRPYELEQLGMLTIGHQEIVLEAVEYLRNFHYNIDKENLQFLALNVATAARSLYRQLAHHCDKSKIETQILNDITRTIGTIKPVISWLDRSPFQGHVQFNEIRKNMLRLGLEMATSAQRDRFVENPVDQIRMTAEKLAKLADYIIQDITDPMLLQPASLNLVTLKKRESDLGFNIIPSYHGIHRVTDIKYNSPAHNSGKIEDGDEIVQINYQTVVGWQLKTVSLHLRESPPDVLLTLKKRPKHTKIYGQIYMQPYRLPSKKRSLGSRWGEHVPSPRPGFLAVPDFNLPIKVSEKTTIASSDSDSSCSDILTPTDDPKTEDKEIRLYYPKPRAVLQRRNTICGDELYGFRKVVPLWHERASGQIGDPSSPSLRDKSVSFGFGLEIAQRPTTCLGISTGNGKFNELIPFNSTLAEKAKDKAKLKINEIISGEKPKPGVSKVVRFDANMKGENYTVDEKYICKIENTILETFIPIPYADEEESVLTEENSIHNEMNLSAVEFRKESPPPLFIKPIRSDNSELVQAINIITVNRRGRLDKSHSTPAYDNSGEDSDTPPAIEPRNEFLNNVPPAPPPRPKRQSELIPPVVPPPPPKPNKTTASSIIVSPKPSPNVNILPVKFPNTFPSPVHVPLKESLFLEESELVTPTKTKTLTLKKKNSMIAKRRKISLKVLGTGEIQGHLYRRRKDKRGISFWAKLYFVLIETVLYGFRSKDAQKANCVVFLPGFTVSVAKEVHSRPFAFKVYHPSKTFYFAAESSEALNQWMEFIRQATLHDKYGSSSFNDNQVDVNSKELFSETDSSGDESDLSKQQLCTPSPVSSNTHKGNSSKQPDTPVSTKHYYFDFGSLKKFTKTSFKTNSDKKQSSDIPVPTDHFRTYRRMPGGSYGIQIGANTPAYQDININLPPAYLGDHSTRNMSVSSTNSAINNPDTLQLPQATDSKPRATRDSLDENKKLCKTSPFNYIHASNPNLVEFSFQTSKTLDYSKPKINAANSWDAQSNLQGFVTLKDLMLQKQEEDAQEMYNNRVLLGVEKENANRGILQENTTISSSGNEKVTKIQMRSLPKTPDYEMSFKPDDEDIRRTRTKEGQKLRDFGYEFICGDDPPTNDVFNLKKINQSIPSPPVVQSASLSKNKKHSSNSYSENVNEKSNRASSFKKKGKFDAFKTSSERLFQFKHSNNDKSTDSMTLPLHKKSLQIYNQQTNPVIGGSIKKSHTYNNDFKDKKYDVHRKNSAPPMPILSKLNFTSNKTTKEKKWLSSPRFQRAIFGRTTSVSSQHDYDHEIFLPITFPKTIGDDSDTRSLSENTCNRTTQGTIEKPLSLPPTQTLPTSVVTPEYPNLQCPPVFEPETYSLSDPNTLIRRRNNLEEPE